ncbi:peroxiredoxin family protein [Haoranjiania flava]|uniref:TlpA family protein disulfide reductase n=1 Tax=Haoranjiania flava TaxID=1856322 RepID=A0AAE3LJP3_9BACT|nr:TlpA disulfide reductase family protein [Haoranjiania flava]MCU7693793.1 TlpA family protein disulfide reductase [Haoranjiania flava]
MKRTLFLIALLIGSSQLLAQDIPEGKWLGQLHRPDGINIPFQFETATVNGSTQVHFINAEERLLADEIEFNGDSVKLTMPFFDAWFMVKPSYQELVGNYYKRSGEKITIIPFSLAFDNTQRFQSKRPPTADISGKWSVRLGENMQDTGIGIFKQHASGKLTGTILTPTGDYRYMEGIVDGDSLKLSVFDGGFAMLLTAAIRDKNTITGGTLYSGISGKQSWSATRNDAIQLQEEPASKMRPGENKLNFSFPALTTGEMISINDKRYKGKVVLVQILGSWCPNCMDETAFLSDYYNKNKQRGLEVIGIAYERTTDIGKNKKLLEPYIKRFNVQYPILQPPVAVSDPQRTEKTLPQIDKISAFPSLIYIDRKGIVRKIYSGFSGPATGEFYENYKQKFYAEMDKLLGEMNG